MASFVVNNGVESTVADNPLSNVATILNVATGEGANFPSTFPYRLTIWDESTYPEPADDSNTEIVHVTGRATDALTIVRGKEGTSGVEHALSSRVAMLITAGMFNDSTHGITTKLDTIENGADVNTGAIWLPVEAAYLPITNPAALVEHVGATVYSGWSTADFDDTTKESIVWRVPMPDYNNGNIAIKTFGRPKTTPGGAVTAQFDILTIGLATSEAFDSAVTVDTTVNLSFSLNTTELQTDIIVATATIDPANVTTDDIMVFELERDVGTDDLTGDFELMYILIEYTKV